MTAVRFLLASQSPRRRELLGLAGFPFQVQVAGVDEALVTIPDPAQNSIDTARLKAETIAAQPPEAHGEHLIIVAADTTVALDGAMLGKPSSAADARRMLLALRGRAHQVHTGMALFDLASGRELTAVHSATVTMRPYSDREITQYIASGDPLDKAGAYAIQHPRFRPAAALDGCFLGVMGFCLCQFLCALDQLAVPRRADFSALRRAHQGYACPYLGETDLLCSAAAVQVARTS